MLCSKCQLRIGKIEIQRHEAGQLVNYILCDECAKTFEDYDLETSFSDNDLLTSLIESVQQSPLQVSYILTTTCSSCGMTYGSYRKTGRVGCSKCYESFKEKLIPLIQELHGAAVHVGKAPRNYSDYQEIKRKILALKSELKVAISKEDFEKAAAIRDDVEALEAQMR
ncbi:MAG: UvrB/UvrC motif-containing protein [Clostridia bacterium]|nr:UvrB/UvrC motif-containing protein [Clostridia bacterium]